MSKEYVIKSWRTPSEKKPQFGVEHEMLPTTKIFDQLTFIGDEAVSCFLLESTEGLILIDCMEPKEKHMDGILKGISDIGYEVSDLKAILITHGHGDHYGFAGKIRDLSGAKIYISEGDYALANSPRKPGDPPFAGMDYPVDGYLEDGMDFVLGDASVHCVMTPGHTDHCMSFIIPVTDDGEPHKVALWGGTGLNPGVNINTYLCSVDKFEKVCEVCGVDGEISNHPPVDNGVERTALVRNIVNGIPNPFVLGREGVKYFFEKFRTMAKAALEKYPDGIVPRRRPPFGRAPAPKA